jgi:hypothetical protein
VSSSVSLVLWRFLGLDELLEAFGAEEVGIFSRCLLDLLDRVALDMMSRCRIDDRVDSKKKKNELIEQ